EPARPTDAKGYVLKLAEPMACTYEFFVDAQGVPTRVSTVQCPDARYVDAAMPALVQWRFYPSIEDGMAKASTFTLDVVMQPTGRPYYKIATRVTEPQLLDRDTTGQGIKASQTR